MTAADADERFEAALWFWCAELLKRADLADVQPASGALRMDDGVAHYSVASASRGRVTLGAIDLAAIRDVAATLDADQLAGYREWVVQAKAAALDIIQPYAQALEARRVAPLAGKTKAMDAKIARAVELHKAGKSPARIAQLMTAEGLIKGDKDPARSVRRWLATAEKRTVRKVSDSR